MSLAAGWVLLLGALAVLALPLVVPRVDGHNDWWCRYVFAHSFPGAPLVAWASVMMALVLVTRFLRRVAKAMKLRRLCRIEPGLVNPRVIEGSEVYVLPVGKEVAYSVPAAVGSPAQVVLSQGLVDRLDVPALAAVVRHEAAHVTHRHDRFLLVVEAIASTLTPWRAPGASAAAVEFAVERWADERATGSSTDRRWALGSAIVRAGRTGHERLPVPVGQRLRALKAAPIVTGGGTRALTYGSLGLAVLAPVLLLLAVATDAHGALPFVALCG